MVWFLHEYKAQLAHSILVFPEILHTYEMFTSCPPGPLTFTMLVVALGLYKARYVITKSPRTIDFVDARLIHKKKFYPRDLANRLIKTAFSQMLPTKFNTYGSDINLTIRWKNNSY